MTQWAWALLALAGMAGVVSGALSMRRRARELERLLESADRKLEQLQQKFERFVPSDVVERLTGDRGEYIPERRQVTMLFADLRGFTAMCDRLDPAVTVTILNGYFDHMNRAIDLHHGHLVELIGDGLLALFGALEPNPWQRRDSVLAALEMRAELKRFNEKLREQGVPELRFGIGIHCGDVVAGVMGPAGLSKFSVTGDPINLASRVEGLTSVHNVDLLITEDVRAGLDDSFHLRPMPAVLVKGKPEPIRTYHVENAYAPSMSQAPATEMASPPTRSSLAS
jgi:class 3 adenylate cyclase